MHPRERMLTLLRGGVPDKLPFFHSDHYLLRGEKEREARNRGMRIIVHRPCYVESMTNVEIVTKSEPGHLVRTYKTPLGSLTEVLEIGIGYGLTGWKFMDWRGMSEGVPSKET